MKPEEQQQIISIHTVASSRILSYIQSPHTVNSEVTWKAVKKEKSINTCQQTYKKITLNECPENTEKPQLPRPSLWTCLVTSRWYLTLDTTAGPDLDPAGWHPSMTSDLAHHYKHLQRCGLSVQPVPGSHTHWPGSFRYSIYRGFHVEYQTCFLEAMWDFDLSE